MENMENTDCHAFYLKNRSSKSLLYTKKYEEWRQYYMGRKEITEAGFLKSGGDVIIKVEGNKQFEFSLKFEQEEQNLYHEKQTNGLIVLTVDDDVGVTIKRKALIVDEQKEKRKKKKKRSAVHSFLFAKSKYDVLEVRRDASLDEIKKSYHRLARRYHPDRSTGDEFIMKQINDAYETLKDKNSRMEYDKGLDSNAAFFSKAFWRLLWQDKRRRNVAICSSLAVIVGLIIIGVTGGIGAVPVILLPITALGSGLIGAGMGTIRYVCKPEVAANGVDYKTLAKVAAVNGAFGAIAGGAGAGIGSLVSTALPSLSAPAIGAINGAIDGTLWAPVPILAQAAVEDRWKEKTWTEIGLDLGAGILTGAAIGAASGAIAGAITSSVSVQSAADDIGGATGGTLQDPVRNLRRYLPSKSNSIRGINSVRNINYIRKVHQSFKIPHLGNKYISRITISRNMNFTGKNFKTLYPQGGSKCVRGINIPRNTKSIGNRNVYKRFRPTHPLSRSYKYRIASTSGVKFVRHGNKVLDVAALCWKETLKGFVKGTVKSLNTMRGAAAHTCSNEDIVEGMIPEEKIVFSFENQAKLFAAMFVKYDLNGQQKSEIGFHKDIIAIDNQAKNITVEFKVLLYKKPYAPDIRTVKKFDRRTEKFVVPTCNEQFLYLHNHQVVDSAQCSLRRSYVLEGTLFYERVSEIRDHRRDIVVF